MLNVNPSGAYIGIRPTMTNLSWKHNLVPSNVAGRIVNDEPFFIQVPDSPRLLDQVLLHLFSSHVVPFVGGSKHWVLLGKLHILFVVVILLFSSENNMSEFLSVEVPFRSLLKEVRSDNFVLDASCSWQ